MRLLILCLAVLALARGAPIYDGAVENAALEQVDPEAITNAPVVDETASPDEPKELPASEDQSAPEGAPAFEEPARSDETAVAEDPDKVPASEETAAPDEAAALGDAAAPEEPERELAFIEPVLPDETGATEKTVELPASKEQVTPVVPEAFEGEAKPEAPTEKPLAPESEPISEPHEESAPVSPDQEAPIEAPETLDGATPESHPEEAGNSYTIFPPIQEWEHSQMILPETSFIDYLLWALFGGEDENAIDYSDFLWPSSEPESQKSEVNHPASPLQAESKGEVMFVIWGD